MTIVENSQLCKININRRIDSSFLTLSLHTDQGVVGHFFAKVVVYEEVTDLGNSLFERVHPQRHRRRRLPRINSVDGYLFYYGEWSGPNCSIIKVYKEWRGPGVILILTSEFIGKTSKVVVHWTSPCRDLIDLVSYFRNKTVSSSWYKYVSYQRESRRISH